MGRCSQCLPPPLQTRYLLLGGKTHTLSEHSRMAKRSFRLAERPAILEAIPYMSKTNSFLAPFPLAKSKKCWSVEWTPTRRAPKLPVGVGHDESIWCNIHGLEFFRPLSLDDRAVKLNFPAQSLSSFSYRAHCSQRIYSKLTFLDTPFFAGLVANEKFWYPSDISAVKPSTN